MRSLAVLAAALVLVACDSTEPTEVSLTASAREVTLLGVDPAPHGGLALRFGYVGTTPSPCYSYSGYGTSTTRTPGDDPDAPRRIEVHVSVANPTDAPCSREIGTVETELEVSIDAEGLYVVAFEREGLPPLERRVRVTLAAAVEE